MPSFSLIVTYNRTVFVSLNTSSGYEPLYISIIRPLKNSAFSLKWLFDVGTVLQSLLDINSEVPQGCITWSNEEELLQLVAPLAEAGVAVEDSNEELGQAQG